MTAAETIGCAGGCGAKWPVDDLDRCPWETLEITNRRRCWDCSRALDQAAHAVGTEARFEPDPLPADSRGALKELRQPAPLREEVKP